MKKTLLIFIGVILVGSAAMKSVAQAVPQNLDNYYQELSLSHEMNGNVAASQNGKTIYQRSFGFKDIAAQKKNDKNTQFELASVTKLFTATAVLQLKERGLINLDAPFQYYFPEFPYAKITIRHLLSHTSGLPDIETFVDSLIAKYPEKQFTIRDDPQNVIAYSRNHVLTAQPGEKWMYSSAGYHLLALLVEKISGQTMAAYVRDYIFQPARMIHSYVQTSMKQKEDPDRTKNYQYRNHIAFQLQWVDTVKNLKEWSYNLALETGGGGIISTTSDMLRFDAALNAGKLLKPKTLEEAYAPYILNNGKPAQLFDLTYCCLGWFVFKDTSHGRVVWGSGSNPGKISFFARNIDRHQCLVVLHNIKSNSFNDINAVNILNGQKLTYHIPLAFVYAQDLYKKGQGYADEHFKTLLHDTAKYVLTESDLNNAAVEMRRMGKKEALMICELDVQTFPQSADAYATYGFTLNRFGQKEKSIIAYKKAIELNPGDQESKDALKKLMGDQLKTN